MKKRSWTSTDAMSSHSLVTRTLGNSRGSLGCNRLSPTVNVLGLQRWLRQHIGRLPTGDYIEPASQRQPFDGALAAMTLALSAIRGCPRATRASILVPDCAAVHLASRLSLCDRCRRHTPEPERTQTVPWPQPTTVQLLDPAPQRTHRAECLPSPHPCRGLAIVLSLRHSRDRFTLPFHLSSLRASAAPSSTGHQWPPVPPQCAQQHRCQNGGPRLRRRHRSP